MTERSKSAALLTVGTEITSGEIVNSNAAWISQRLVDLGFIVDLHIAVADERSDIQKALQICCEQSSVVIVTGGLGPTSDDFTREEIAKFVNRSMKWHEPSWQHIVKRLTSLSTVIAESNKQQCWFPEGAEILANPEGTAAGFFYSDKQKNTDFFVLPGPPREIEAIWNQSIYQRLQSRIPKDQQQILKRWKTIGLSESKIGEIVEEALAGSGFTTGYRSHIPYIDIKVWIPTTQSNAFSEQWEAKLEGAIAKWLVGRNDDDLAEIFWRKSPDNLQIFDHATRGQLAQRLCSVKNVPTKNISIITGDKRSVPGSTESATIQISSDIHSGHWTVEWISASGTKKEFSEVSRYKTAAHAERFQKYICERVLHIVTHW